MLQKVVMYHKKKQKPSGNSILPLIRGGHGIVVGVPILRKLEIVPPTNRYFVTHHQPKSTVNAGEKSAFLYSPFAKKDATKKTLLFAANEMVHIDVTLANPFMFDIDVQSLVIW